MHIPITRRIRSIVDESHVPVIQVASSNPVTVPCFFFSILYFYQFIYIFKDIIHNHLQTIWVAENRFNDTNNAYPIELMRSVASRICIFVFDNVPFDGHFV